MTVNIGLSASTIKKISDTLRLVLADTYVLYVKTQNFHWNLIDPRFYPLHKMLEEQYEKLAEAVDQVAERIRALGAISPGSLKEFLNLTSLKESDGILSGDSMLKDLLKDHETVIKALRKGIHEANSLGDDGTGDLLIELIRDHEKTAWILRSHVEKK